MSRDVTINATRNTSTALNPDQQNHSRMRKVAFAQDDDTLLMKYIATYNPQLKGRLGMKLYERLVENAERKWSFSSRHSVQSWRERYKNNQPWFDAKILKYQEKHGISASAVDNSFSQSTVQGGVTKSLPVSWKSRTNTPSGSTAPVGENGAKKRRREVEAEDTNLYPGVVKKMRQEMVSAQGSQPCDSPPHTRFPSAELRNGEKFCAESSCHEEEEAAPVIGPDDYTGALFGSGESDQEVGSQSKDRGVGASARVSRPSTPANNAEVKPLASRRSASPRLVGATTTYGEPSFSHQQHDISSEAAVAEASEFVRDSICAATQPSQEPTPPHTSAINSPRSPLQRQPSPMNGALSQPETGSRQISSISQKQKRISSSRRKRTIVSRDEDDIFSTPPPQAVRASPPPRSRGREAPHLVEGPFRSAYTNSNGQFLSMLRSPNGTDEEAGADDADEEWPPRRRKRRSPIPSERLNSTPSREHEQSIANAQPQRPPSSTPYAPNAVPIDQTISAIEPAITHKNSRGSISQISQIRAVPLQVVRAETSAVAESSKDAHRPPQPKTISSSRDRLPPNFKPRLSTHDSIEAKGPAPVTSHNRLLFPAAPAHELPPPAPGPPSKRASLGQNPNPASLDDPSVNDPFKVPLVNREARRWTLAGNSETPRVDARRGDLVRRASVHHIDLRALHLGKSVGTSLFGRAISVGCSNTSGSSSTTTKKWPRKPSRSSTPPNLSESNKKLVLSLGLEAVYSRMAENHKFHIDVVREVAAEQSSLEDTDRVLCNMRLAASREFARLLRQNEAAYPPVGCETGESEEEDEDDDNSGDEDDDSLSVQPSHVSLSSNHSPSPTSPVPQGRARRLAIKIPTASPDPSPTRPSDYSPPTPTRARAFRRLERQGRVEEARLREARLVRRSLPSSSAEASPEADEQRITTYLLQLQEDKDGVPLEKPQNTSGPECLGEQDGEDETQEDGRGVGRSISPGLEEGHADADTRQFQGNGIAEDDRDRVNVVIHPVCDQEVPDDALLSPLGHGLENSGGFIDEDASYVTKAMVDRHLSWRSELEDEGADTAEVEEQVDADGDCQTLSDPQVMSPEAESHMDSTGVDDGVIAANARQSPPGNVLTEEIGHYGSPLDKKYAGKATSSLARSALASLSVLDAEWTNSDDELLLDGNLTEHEGLVRRKGLCSVKFRTAHLYSLLLDG
ncbi:hypothetical protein F5888DRAFT_1831648 [Russula emetica]|nr:hypothetical protein F5888DRAFT_1831648 [Russula emetica]